MAKVNKTAKWSNEENKIKSIYSENEKGRKHTNSKDKEFNSARNNKIKWKPEGEVRQRRKQQ